MKIIKQNNYIEINNIDDLRTIIGGVMPKGTSQIYTASPASSTCSLPRPIPGFEQLHEPKKLSPDQTRDFDRSIGITHHNRTREVQEKGYRVRSASAPVEYSEDNVNLHGIPISVFDGTNDKSFNIVVESALHPDIFSDLSETPLTTEVDPGFNIQDYPGESGLGICKCIIL